MQDNFSEKSLISLLKKHFGYKSFRPGQLDVIKSVLSGNDTLAVMPTGGGKSLCCQLPALVFKGITIVVSPLIALMQDQVSQLEEAGIEALFLNSSLTLDQYSLNTSLIRGGKVKIVYCAPETLVTERMQQLLANVQVSLLTIDEAHCISEWGHDFRPEYRMIASVRAQHPEAVCLAMTATATQTVRNDIKRSLKLGSKTFGFGFNEFVSTFNRPNIFLEVKSKAGSVQNAAALLKKPTNFRLTRADELLLEFLQEHKNESGIIYCFSRKQVDELTEFLQEQNYKALAYHAGLSDTERAENQRLFVQDEVPIIVATLAFGMGINKPNVRFVVHYDMPKSLEQYYQEIGRAGRDGENAHALLLYSYGDTNKIRFFMQDKTGTELAAAEKQLEAMTAFAQSRTCRRSLLLAHFGEPPAESNPDFCCDICSSGLNAAELETDVTIPAQKLLSAILRTGEKFGASYVIDVLLGSRQKRILDYGHHKLSVFGIGTEFSKQDWYQLVNLLIDAGFLRKSSDYQVLSLTRDAKDTLRDRGEVRLPFVPHTNAPAQTQKSGKTGSYKRILDSSDIKGMAILEALKEMRRKLAKEAEVPPYIIFGDRTLEDIAIKKPVVFSQLTDIYGIGEIKAERYGGFIISIVREHQT
ncbi:MAG: DNA helicase RecQ [Spirochaetaceae bacterium]|nr:DNA helicase RecQ [Spirochaetaceae bacterium]